ncbi:HNH endonuclease [Olsenella sp. HMSC062G07]|uniref:HNH endonuclease n=1 Tax=Olsenella sp. HMSC062G07 TaxID=1739330 RepID=UPI0008A4AF84|nr:HNH endonuclease [Olsenella sp. HMSC062G07]OFK22957.1 hypothetical protein HMPREF2826_00685 [Olsenella sp. HMSC062G07]
MSRRFCPHCGRVFRGDRCPCRPRPKRKGTAGDATRGEREPWRRRYATAAYRRARQQAIASAHGRCVDCGRVCATYDGNQWRTAALGGEVDHVRALCDGGTDEPSNLRLRCKSCHKKRDDKRRRGSE